MRPGDVVILALLGLILLRNTRPAVVVAAPPVAVFPDFGLPGFYVKGLGG